MDAGISTENGNPQDITFAVNPGEVFVVPQNTLHHNHNAQCEPNVWLQSFTSSDPGALNMIGAISALGAAGEAGSAAITASGAQEIMPSPQGAFALDQACLQKCGFPAEGAPNDGLDDLPDTFKVLFGLGAGGAGGGDGAATGEAAGEARGVTDGGDAAFSNRLTCGSAVLAALVAAVSFVLT